VSDIFPSVAEPRHSSQPDAQIWRDPASDGARRHRPDDPARQVPGCTTRGTGRAEVFTVSPEAGVAPAQLSPQCAVGPPMALCNALQPEWP